MMFIGCDRLAVESKQIIHLSTNVQYIISNELVASKCDKNKTADVGASNTESSIDWQKSANSGNIKRFWEKPNATNNKTASIANGRLP